MFRFHREGFTSIILTLLFCAALNVAAWALLPWAALQIVVWVLSMALLVLILQFFRNPRRTIAKADDQLIYAPADGKIVVIETAAEPEFFEGQPRLQVSIFMSPLNVHVNRNPISGKVLYSQYHPGKYLVAWHPKASTENERTTVVYERKDGARILMRQIAGALAKRIINYLKAGDQVKQGEDMGFIKLGSRVDLFLPLNAEVQVKIGDMVYGNKTVIAKLP